MLRCAYCSHTLVLSSVSMRKWTRLCPQHTHRICVPLFARVFVHSYSTEALVYLRTRFFVHGFRPRFNAVACVRLFTCAHVSTRTHTHARALTPDRSRHRTIFERGKERSRTNFLHNFGSPRADSNSHYYTKPRGSEQRSLCFARRGFPRSASIARACNSAARWTRREHVSFTRVL